MKILGHVKGTSAAEMLAYEYYRVYLPLREVNRKTDIEATIIDNEQMPYFRDSEMADYDLYVCSRQISDEGRNREFVDTIHGYGAKIVYDIDDDLTDEVKHISGYGDLYKEMLGLVDYVTVTTARLAERFSRFTQREPVILPNYLDTRWMAGNAASAERVVPGLTIGYSGTWTHWDDWYWSFTAFQDVAAQPGVQPLVLGYCPPYVEDGVPGLIRIEKAPYAIYPQALSQFDLLLCTLNTTQPEPPYKPEYEPPGGNYQWNEGKSGVKALEAMAVGAVALCSDIPAYRALYEAGAPIILVEGVNDWGAEIIQIVENTDLRESLSAEGPGWVARNRDMCNTGWELWADFYRGLAEPSS